MGEKYIGVKFQVILDRKSVPCDKRMEELAFWCRKFDETGLAPSYGKISSGNLSFRVSDGFVITATGKNMKGINAEDFVKVVNCDIKKMKVYTTGLLKPSSESFLHWLIYKNRKDVNAVFHGHDRAVLKKARKLNLVITEEEQPYGTINLANEVLKVLGKNNYVVIKNHGIISLGGSMREAGELAIRMHKLA